MANNGRYMKLSNSPLSELEETVNKINKEKEKFKRAGVNGKSFDITNILYYHDENNTFKQSLIEKLTNKHPELKPVIKNIEKRRNRAKIPEVIGNIINFPLILSAMAIKIAALVVTVPACALLNKGKKVLRDDTSSVAKQVAGGLAVGTGSVAIGGIYFPLAVAEKIVLLPIEVQEKILEKIFFPDKQFKKDALKIQEAIATDNELYC